MPRYWGRSSLWTWRPGEVVVRGPGGNSVTLTARGRMHTVSGAEMAKLDNVRLGDTVVVVFTEALVLSLKEN